MSADSREYHRQYYAAHIDHLRVQKAACQAARRQRLRDAGLPTRSDRDRERGRAAYRADPERVKKAVAEWQRADRRRKFASTANVKAKKLGIPGRLDWRELPELPRPCHYCGTEAQGFDHVIPFVAGGPNTIENLVPCCLPCNERKNRFPSNGPGGSVIEQIS